MRCLLLISSAMATRSRARRTLVGEEAGPIKVITRGATRDKISKENSLKLFCFLFSFATLKSMHMREASTGIVEMALISNTDVPVCPCTNASLASFLDIIAILLIFKTTRLVCGSFILDFSAACSFLFAGA